MKIMTFKLYLWNIKKRMLWSLNEHILYKIGRIPDMKDWLDQFIEGVLAIQC